MIVSKLHLFSKVVEFTDNPVLEYRVCSFAVLEVLSHKCPNDGVFDNESREIDIKSICATKLLGTR